MTNTDADTFVVALHAAGQRLAPAATASERIRLVAERLDAAETTVRRWWYDRSRPRGAALVAVLAQLEAIGQDGRFEVPQGLDEMGIRADERAKTEDYVCRRLIGWMDETPRRDAQTAFTAGPLRDVARRIEEDKDP